jgi:hypothetical protein
MPYAGIQDVRDLAPYVRIDQNSQPAEGTVLKWITETETLVDATLKGIGYEVPITGASSRAITRDIVANLVMARVMRGRPNPESDPEAFRRAGDDILKRLRDPNDPLEFVDAVMVDTTVKEAAVRVSSNLRDLANEDPRRFPTRDQVF